jgi:transposase
MQHSTASCCTTTTTISAVHYFVIYQIVTNLWEQGSTAKKVDRHPTPKDLHEKIRSLKKKHPDLSIDAIAEHVGISHGTVWNCLSR